MQRNRVSIIYMIINFDIYILLKLNRRVKTNNNRHLTITNLMYSTLVKYKQIWTKNGVHYYQ